MSTRITKPTKDLMTLIFQAWHASIPRMFDNDRTAEACLASLDDVSTHWFAVPQGFLILRGVVPGNTASVVTISTDGKAFVNLAETQRVLSDAMKEFKLRRVVLLAPTPTEWRDYKLLGFQHEGRIRKAVLFNNEWCDAEMLGALEHEVGKSHRRNRKRYKSNGPSTRPFNKVKNHGRNP